LCSIETPLLSGMGHRLIRTDLRGLTGARIREQKKEIPVAFTLNYLVMDT
jgi:hypothetical protein